MPPHSMRLSNSRPRSKSSSSGNNILDDSRPNSSRSTTLPGTSSSPSVATITPATLEHTAPPPAPDTPKNNSGYTNSSTPRKNGRRRYIPRQIPPASFRPLPQSSTPSMQSPKHSPSEKDVAQFISLTQQLNGQMDGLVDYHLSGGRWERWSLPF